MDNVKIIECPRDAWQGLPKIIPPELKAAYHQRLLRDGFRHIDAVSFVSPKYVPQMADSETVMQMLRERESASLCGAEIIGIVVNEQGFQRALQTPGVTTIGYPYSLSERFAQQNANMSLDDSRRLVEKLQSALGGPDQGRSNVRRTPDFQTKKPSLVVYISMAFGNPYGDSWAPEMVAETLEWLRMIGVRTVSLADTIGKAHPEDVKNLFRSVQDATVDMEIGVHLHSRREGAAEKVLAAYDAGCRRFDSALTGLGGCPFAGDELVGNIPTEIVVNTLASRGVSVGIEPEGMQDALKASEEIRAEFSH
jgi:hydroxymethylglutaryl-CoA lyase